MVTMAVEASGITKTFGRQKKALDNVSIKVCDGEMVALIGASGSGKSTLLRHISGLIAADKGPEGEVRVRGACMQRGGQIASDAPTIRSSVGMIFQQFNLVGRMSVLTNVLTGYLGSMPRLKGTFGLFSQAQRQAAMLALRRVGIDAQALQRGSDLSGGQQQRAAIARTLVQGAKIIVADEPIASLDPSAARRVMDILAELNQRDGITVVVSLHQVEYALNYCPRTIALRDGKVVYDGPSNVLTPQFLGDLYGAESEELFLPGLEEQEPEPAARKAANGAEPIAAQGQVAGAAA